MIKFIPFFLLLSFYISAQSTRGVETVMESDEGMSYALIIGISDYKMLPQLSFADRDAQVFASYLKNFAMVPDENIKVFLNENATRTNFLDQLNSFDKTLKRGDRLYIYFAGHGDNETKLGKEQSLLLLYNAPNKNYLLHSSQDFIRIEDLKSYVGNFLMKKIEIVLIADACHSGELIGGKQGAEATSLALKDSWQNETKILSCQPNEMSIEGKQWGGGRGLFSYYLIEGLIGLADENKDNQISSLEIQKYLQEKVSSEFEQIPIVTGQLDKIIAKVNVDSLNTLKERKKNNLPTFTNVELKGNEDFYFTNKDSLFKQAYLDFAQCISQDKLIDSTDINALFYYNLLQRSSISQKLKNIVKRSFLSALLRKSNELVFDLNQFRNIKNYLNYLKENKSKGEILFNESDLVDEVRLLNKIERKLNLNIKELSIALDIIGPDHLLRNSILARRYNWVAIKEFISGFINITLIDKEVRYPIDSYSEILKKTSNNLEKSLNYEENVFTYITLYFTTVWFNPQKADSISKRLKLLLPNESLCHVLPSITMMSKLVKNEIVPSKRYLQVLISDLEVAENKIELKEDKFAKGIIVFLKCIFFIFQNNKNEFYSLINEISDDKIYESMIGNTYGILDIDKLILLNKKGLTNTVYAKDKYKYYKNLGALYGSQCDIQNALSSYKKSLENINDSIDKKYIYFDLGELYIKTGDTNNAIEYLNLAIRNGIHYFGYTVLADIYISQGKNIVAEELLQSALFNKDTFSKKKDRNYIYKALSKIYPDSDYSRKEVFLLKCLDNFSDDSEFIYPILFRLYHLNINKNNKKYFEERIKLLEIKIFNNPKYVSFINKGLSELYIDIGLEEYAIKKIDSLLVKYPSEELDLRLSKIDLLEEISQEEEIEIEFSKLRKKYAQFEEKILLRLAKYYEETEKKVLSLNLYKELFEKYSTLENYEILSDIIAESDYSESNVEYLRILSKNYPDFGGLIYRTLGEYYENNDSIKTAESLYLKAIDFNPFYGIDIYPRLAEMYKFVDSLSIAQKYFELMMMEFPNEYITWIYYGQLLEEMENIKAAENTYKAAIKRFPCIKNFHDFLGNLYFKEKNYKKSIIELESGTVNQYSLFSLGTAYLKIKNIDKSIELFSRSLEEIKKEYMLSQARKEINVYLKINYESKPYDISKLFIAENQYEEAIKFIEIGLSNEISARIKINQIKNDKEYESIIKTQKFKNLEKKYGIE